MTSATAEALEPYAVFVGGYTAAMDGKSTGISVFTATGADSDEVEFTAGVPAALESPSFLIKHPLHPWIYAISESEPGRLHAFSYGVDGTLSLINSVQTGGDGGCHLCFDQSMNRVLVAHYGSGSVASFAIEGDGAVSERTGLITFVGSGPDPERQDAPHAHQVVSVGGVILVPDLGTDSIHIVSVDADGALSEAADPIPLPAGSGPRHLVVAANHLVVACELSAEVWVSRLDAELGAAGRTVPSSGRDTTERVYPSAIASYRDQIVVANRGSNTLSFFTLEDGTLEVVEEIDCGGVWPRDLTIDGDQLWVSNQYDDTISVFTRGREPEPDRWTIDFQIPSPDPACVIVAH